MFELLFKYPMAVFNRGTFVLLSGWPMWMLGVAIALAVGALGFLVWRRAQGSESIGAFRAASVWILQSLMAALLLFLLWHPALSVATLKPQQNIVAVLLDNSASMAVADEGGASRKDREISVLNSALMKDLQEKFQVRLP